MKIPKPVRFVSVVIAASIIGACVRSSILNSEIKKLETQRDEISTTLESLISNTSLSSSNYINDKKYFELMFNEIFTFYNIDDFDNAKRTAYEYGLPESFVESFYNKKELTNSDYTGASIDVVCKYDSAEYFLLQETDSGERYYMINVKLDMVKFNYLINLMFFIEVTNGESRVKSMIYYTL